jgi:hypothetical protein
MEKQKKNLYHVLGVDRSATKDEIKEAYKKKAKETHPDVSGGDAEKFREINEAYECLIDDDRRIEYDVTGNEELIDDKKRIIDYLVGTIIPPILSAKTLEGVNLVAVVEKVISMHRFNEIKKQDDCLFTLKNIDEVLKRLKLKDGVESDNVFITVLKQKKSDIENEIKWLKKEVEFYEHALSFIENYEYVVDVMDTSDWKKLYRKNETD